MPASPGSQRLWRVPRGALVRPPPGHRGRTSVPALLLRRGGARAWPSKAVRPARARPTASRRNAGRGSPGFSWQRTRFQSSPRCGASLTRLAVPVLKRHRRRRLRISERGHGFFLRRRLRQSPPVAECATVCVAPFLSILPHIRPFRNLPATPSVWLGGSGGRCALDAAFTIFDEHFWLTR